MSAYKIRYERFDNTWHVYTDRDGTVSEHGDKSAAEIAAAQLRDAQRDAPRDESWDGQSGYGSGGSSDDEIYGGGLD